MYFGKKKKNLHETCACLLVTTIGYLQNPEHPKKKHKYEKYVQRIKEVLNGTNKYIQGTPENLVSLSKDVYLNRALYKLIMNSPKLSFEQKKEVINLVRDIFKVADNKNNQEIHHSPIYFQNAKFKEVLDFLLDSYSQPEMCTFAGNIIRTFTKYEGLLSQILNLQILEKLINQVEDSRFEISSEAFETFRAIFTHKKESEKKIVADFILQNYDEFFRLYKSLINYDNYLSQRTCLKTLYEILDDPVNSEIMIKFISSKDNLRMIIDLLSNENKGIQFEAFMLLELLIRNISKATEPDIKTLILHNKLVLVKFIKGLEVESEQEYDYNKDVMLHYLDSLH